MKKSTSINTTLITFYGAKTDNTTSVNHTTVNETEIKKIIKTLEYIIKKLEKKVSTFYKNTCNN